MQANGRTAVSRQSETNPRKSLERVCKAVWPDVAKRELEQSKFKKLGEKGRVRDTGHHVTPLFY